MGATVSVLARQRAEQALLERMSALDVACDALDARSAYAASTAGALAPCDAPAAHCGHTIYIVVSPVGLSQGHQCPHAASPRVLVCACVRHSHDDSRRDGHRALPALGDGSMALGARTRKFWLKPGHRYLPA